MSPEDSELNPYRNFPVVPTLSVTSAAFEDGDTLPRAQLSAMFGTGGEDVSPPLSWSGVPDTCRGIAITMYDPDAPTGSGFWHWAVVGIPPDVTILDTGAGASGGALPHGAFHLVNDAGFAGYLGAAPPPGHGLHHYFVTVHAVDTDDLGVNEKSSPAYLGFNLFFHTVARGGITGLYGRPAS